jgi:DNA-binding NarL/FixJ family response regulator
VLLVELQPIVRLGLTSLFNNARNSQVIGAASTADEAVAAARLHRPDVVIMDADLPSGSGIAAIERISSDDNDNVRVILLASEADPQLVVAGIRAGARGFLLKRTESARLVEAVEIVAADGYVFEQPALVSAVEWLRAGQPRGATLSRLSEQERKILALITLGKTNRAIGTDLNLSQHTVKTYVSGLLKKLGLASRAEAAAFMVRAGDDVST